LKFIKTYKIFENKEIIPKDMVDDIRDILIDLEDGGRISTIVFSGKYRKYVTFYLKDHLDYDGFLFDEISYYVFWLKKYLGENYKGCSVLLIRDKNRYGVGKTGYYATGRNGGNRININLDDEAEVETLKDLPLGNRIENLIIDIK
jgi:hypothetical protein